MTDKEAYTVLLKAWQGNKESEDYPDFDDINEALTIIGRSLECLDLLRKENQKLKEENVVLRKENLKLIKGIENVREKIKIYKITLRSKEYEEEHLKGKYSTLGLANRNGQEKVLEIILEFLKEVLGE